jgi:type IX secretion system PorP/SprF family membrane protein
MAYAYHILLKNEASFSLGIEGRFQEFSIDKQKLEESLGSNDPVLFGTSKKYKGDAGFGIAYASKKFVAGLSVSQLIQSKLKLYESTSGEEGKQYRHYYLQSKYNWQVDETVKIVPSILAIYLPNAPMEVQGGVRVEHGDLFWYGLSLRSKQAWLFSAGINIKQKFRIGYSFDLYNTPSSIYDKGSNGQEIMLHYHFLDKSKN